MSDADVPSGEFSDNDYKNRPDQSGEAVPVVSDSAAVEDGVDAATADSDEQLARDDTDAIDESNIIDSKTRGAKPSGGSYTEPGDEEGIEGNDGRSAVAQ